LALAIVVENGGLGVEHLGDYSELGSVLEALIGNVEHRVASLISTARRIYWCHFRQERLTSLVHCRP
jgi:hypothetical protein